MSTSTRFAQPHQAPAMIGHLSANVVGYAVNEHEERDRFGRRVVVEDWFPIHAGAHCPWTPALAAQFALT